jgi:DNA gyrase/topoisomerase IV subunit A
VIVSPKWTINNGPWEEPGELPTAGTLFAVTEADPYQADRIALRLRVVEALLWGTENAETVLSISRSSRTTDDAVATLGREHAFEEFFAHHIMDMSFGGLTEARAAALHDEAARLRRGESTASPQRGLDERLNDGTMWLDLKEEPEPGEDNDA